jgi:hypothetical protein
MSAALKAVMTVDRLVELMVVLKAVWTAASKAVMLGP